MYIFALVCFLRMSYHIFVEMFQMSLEPLQINFTIQSDTFGIFGNFEFYTEILKYIFLFVLWV